MGAVKSCCKRQVDDKLLVTKLDLSHCGCLEVPPIVFNAERCIETLVLASNQITSLPPQLFHCQELKHLNLNDNCLSFIPPAISSLQHLVSLKLDKNNFQELPDNLKMCKKLKRLSLNNNPWKQIPNIVTQLINLEELYMNDCELNYLPASVGRLAKLKIIELRNNNLCNLPLSMTRLELLSRLDVSDNEFSEFPTCISKLKGLTELLLDNNDLEEIIDIKNLIHLEHLDASYNHIYNVSETIGCCTHLSLLNLSFNYIEQLPNSIGNITNLQTLHLEMNELTELPKSIGKLSLLEELNLCNNKLYSLPNTIGLLRNLKNLNISRNIIEELPSEIGSCTKLTIINAGYNRLQVLPSEIGYLNNLKVLDLVGNFLMYLPITIINLRGVRAIWLSANQNVPLIPFTEDLNIASGERFLTNIALPQLGEIPFRDSKSSDKKPDHNEKAASWNKKIRFAEDENIIPGKLHRTPTPFPKELRAPNKKFRSEEAKPSVNYVNVIDGKVSEPDGPLVHPTTICVSSPLPGANLSESSTTRIREANIRRNNKDNIDSNVPSQDFVNENDEIYVEPDQKFAEYQTGSPHPEENPSSVPDLIETSLPVTIPASRTPILPKRSDKLPPFPQATFPKGNDQYIYTKEPSRVDYKINNEESFKNNNKPTIYSNLVDCDNYKNYQDNNRNEEKQVEMDPQRIREMYQNDVIYSGSRNFADLRSPSLSDYRNANVENHNSRYRDDNYVPASSLNFTRNDYGRVCSSSLLLPPSSLPTANANNETTHSLPPTLNAYLAAFKTPASPSKQELLSLAEQMKNKNISPPCYEIAKMYSTKAALFENNHVDQLKSN